MPPIVTTTGLGILSPMVLITPDASAAALLVADRIGGLISRKPHPVLMLPTGSTPEHLYAELRNRCAAGTLSLAACKSFNLDEYWPCAPDDPISFRYFMDQQLFDHVDIPASSISFLDGTVDEEQVDAHCRDYGGVDLSLLGIGVNGHIAFNEPGAPTDSSTRLVQLAESTRKRPGFPQGPDAPTAGITVGIKTILQSRQIIVMAFGKDKAEPVRRALEGPVSPATPASLLRDHSDVVWVLDADAASGLQDSEQTLS